MSILFIKSIDRVKSDEFWNDSTIMDMEQLEKLLWTELGSKSDYQKEYGDTPIGTLVRKIVGVDRQVVNEAFSSFISDQKLEVHFFNKTVCEGGSNSCILFTDNKFSSLLLF